MKWFHNILLVCLVGLYMTTGAQVKVNYTNASDKDFLGIGEVLNETNRKMVHISSKTKELSTLELQIPGKRLCVLGCRGKLYYLWADEHDVFSFDCEKGEVKGGNPRIQNFLRKWQRECFDNFEENALKGDILFLTSQHSYIGKGQVNKQLFLASDYVSKVDVWKKKQKELLKSVADDDAEFTAAFSDYLDYIYWDQLLESTRLLLVNNMDVPFVLSDKVLELPIEKEGFTKHSYSNSWLSVYVDVLEARKLIKPTLKDYVYQVATYFKNPELREFYVLNRMGDNIRWRNTIFFKELFEPCRKLVVSEAGKKQYENWMAQVEKTVSENKFDGKQVADLTFRDYEGKERHLSDYKGKYVYIDIWATWCGPCKQETPHFMKLAERMKGQNIVCLSLSADSKNSEQVWKQYVDEHGLRENCEVGWTGNGFSNSFMQYYGINAIPRFMLVAPDGKMIYNDCWRPSNVQIDELLKMYLK